MYSTLCYCNIHSYRYSNIPTVLSSYSFASVNNKPTCRPTATGSRAGWFRSLPRPRGCRCGTGSRGVRHWSFTQRWPGEPRVLWRWLPLLLLAVAFGCGLRLRLVTVAFGCGWWLRLRFVAVAHGAYQAAHVTLSTPRVVELRSRTIYIHTYGSATTTYTTMFTILYIAEPYVHM